MKKETRDDIRDATQDARRLLEQDFAEQLQGDYDIMSDGRVGEKPGAHLIGWQKILRARIVAAIEHKKMAGMTAKEAVADYLRDAAFTTLNRFVALKMLEARDLVQECISKGEASSGFANEFCAMAPGVKFPDGSGYRLYIESIFDELSTEVKVLFDRREPASALWPRKAAFEGLLDILNADKLNGVWIEDETIGWAYQYFNSADERAKLRKESNTPRNSRELAIRNQFFTPRYVVQFLSDNTMGRIWYEMRKGDTAFKDLCEYMVRQPGETFAQEDEEVPDDVIPEGMTQEQLWRRPIKVRHRPKKDPRSIRAIDPACGSGHFLLYLFGLLLVMYEEAWADDASPAFKETGRTLRQDYPSIAELRLASPGLILAHNLHGVDIDPRCAQIAQLALWMRAQRAYGDAKILRSDRPLIRRSNIVIAEPMPGDPKLVEEFAATLNPPVIGDLFRAIVGEMRLAGEMGSLLPIERKLSSSIQRARKAFVEQQRQPAQSFLPGMTPEKKQQELDLSGIDDASFFEQAEERILGSLKSFVRDAVNGIGTRRQLFAEDTEQGIALIELMRCRFDVALINPPFGVGSLKAKEAFEKDYPVTKNDVLTAFIERAIGTSVPRGRIGAITSRTPFFLSSYERWREEIVLKKAPPVVFADLGAGVLDGAAVETAAYSLELI